jgi:FtsP/CotA-like multicopper oxidase with cupredoxin domain
MMTRVINNQGRALLISAMLLLLWALPAQAVIEGLVDSTSGSATFNLSANTDHISTTEGNSLLIWGYANGTATADRAQFPGPTLIVNQNDTVTINLTNNLPQPTSIVFPGQNVTASGGSVGLLTQEAASGGGTVSYSFTASEPGTYTYYSGTSMDLQIEMGLVGALIVRPTGFDIGNPATFTAYGHADSAYDNEYLMLLSEMDPQVHEQVEMGDFAGIDTTSFDPRYWFINGRTGTDTVSGAGVGWLPTQPYSALNLKSPGERTLVRYVGGGRDAHPMHLHGNNYVVFAKDGRLLSTRDPDLATAGADLAYNRNTNDVLPGETLDLIWNWTGYKLGWDIYGAVSDGYVPHNCDDAVNNETGAAGADGFDDAGDNKWEYCLDHDKPFPVRKPDVLEFTPGSMYPGTHVLGGTGFLPPGEGSLNTFGGYFYIWHSHHEKEIINNDIFPGGMLTFMIVVPWALHDAVIPAAPTLPTLPKL